MKVLILHGWGGSDAPHWQAELASTIVKNYGTVSFPLLDNCHYPSKNKWITQVKQILKDFKPDTVVCHSLANILWFWLCLEEEMHPEGCAPELLTVQRLFMVSPPSLKTTEKTIKTFFPCVMPTGIYAKEATIIVSDNDPWVTIDESQHMASHYNIELKIIKNAGHINTDSGYGKWDFIEKLVTKKTKDNIK